MSYQDFDKPTYKERVINLRQKIMTVKQKTLERGLKIVYLTIAVGVVFLVAGWFGTRLDRQCKVIDEACRGGELDIERVQIWSHTPSYYQCVCRGDK